MADAPEFDGRLPDRESEHSSAWRSRLTPDDRARGAVAAWVIYAPWAHPFWSNYAITVCHLRPAAGRPEPVIHLPGATHEMLLVALSPDLPPRLDAPLSTRLTPANFAAQWVAASDIDAEQKIERCVEEIVAADLSPDTDFRRGWIRRFNDSMVR